jgi:sporulation protein YlmC with PRC-barrel domain
MANRSTPSAERRHEAREAARKTCGVDDKELVMPQEPLDGWRGRTVADARGQRLGKVVDLHYDTETGEPEWVVVVMGALGLRQRLVPLAGAEQRGEQIRVRWPRAVVRGAPVWPTETACRPPGDQELRAYYGLGPDPDR